jgi:hypothetical protein
MTQEFFSFLNIASSFCNFLEEKKAGTPKEFISVIQDHLLALYSAGRNLPAIELKEELDVEVGLSDTEMEGVMQFIGEYLPHRYYWHVFDPSDSSDTASVCGDLVDDIGDMYKGIKRSLLLFDNGSDVAKENAAWQVKFDFESHWADHCVNALYAIHYIFQRNQSN